MTFSIKNRSCALLAALITVCAFFSCFALTSSAVEPNEGYIELNNFRLIYTVGNTTHTVTPPRSECQVHYIPVSYDNSYVTYRMELEVPKYFWYVSAGTGERFRFFFAGDPGDIELVVTTTGQNDVYCAAPVGTTVEEFTNFYRITFNATAGQGGLWLSAPTTSWDYLAEIAWEASGVDSFQDPSNFDLSVSVRAIDLNDISSQIDDVESKIDYNSNIANQIKDALMRLVNAMFVPQGTTQQEVQELNDKVGDVTDKITDYTIPSVTQAQKDSALQSISDAGQTFATLMSQANVEPIAYFIQGIYGLPIVGSFLVILTVVALLTWLLRRGED